MSYHVSHFPPFLRHSLLASLMSPFLLDSGFLEALEHLEITELKWALETWATKSLAENQAPQSCSAAAGSVGFHKCWEIEILIF